MGWWGEGEGGGGCEVGFSSEGICWFGLAWPCTCLGGREGMVCLCVCVCVCSCVCVCVFVMDLCDWVFVRRILEQDTQSDTDNVPCHQWAIRWLSVTSRMI